MLSQKARYALHALFVLGTRETPGPMMIADVARKANVPRKFLEQILLELKKTGIVTSQRGKYGGYSLGRPAGEITLAEVLRVIDGPLALSPCASRTAYHKCEDCVDENACGIRRVLLQVRDATAAILESSTIAEAIAFEQQATTKREKL